MVREQLIERIGDVQRLQPDAVDTVTIKETYSTRTRNSIYAERPTSYLITLVGETIKRRVYATPIGNTSAVYIKTNNQYIYCETAVDQALHRGE